MTPHNGPNGDGRFQDEYDAYQYVASPTESDSVLAETNFGLGNYDDDAFWQQIRSYRKGKVAELAFTRRIQEWALHETQVKLAREGFSHYSGTNQEVEVYRPWSELDEDEQDEYGSVVEYGQHIWKKLDEPEAAVSEKQKVALAKKANYTGDWRPIFYRMAQMRHEASRSRGARLLDNLLAGVNIIRGDGDVQDILGGQN